MPIREQAVQNLYELINSGILSKEVESNLEDIAKCIEAEDRENNLGISLWGAEDTDWMDLYVAKRSDLMTPEWEQHCTKVYEKYKIKELLF